VTSGATPLRRETSGAQSGEDAVHAALARLLPERLHRLQRTSGLPVVFGGPVRATSAGPRLVIERLVGTVGQSLHGLAVDSGHGVGGAVVRDAALVRVEDYAATKGITHHYDRIVVEEERLTSMVAVPVLVRGTVQAVLYGAVREGGIGDRAVRSAAVVANLLQRDLEAALAVPVLGVDPQDPARLTAAALADLAALIAETSDPSVGERLSRILADLGGPDLNQRPHGVAQLTPREVEVLRLVHHGATNLEVAAELGLSPETVKAYLGTAMRRLGASSRMVAARTARQWGAF
jgi:DNA-binding CsgD family transcriptional regulator